jgi:hypothetical protein
MIDGDLLATLDLNPVCAPASSNYGMRRTPINRAVPFWRQCGAADAGR